MSESRDRPMDHAEAHERLADLALEPAALERIAAMVRSGSSTDRDERALLDHLRGCPACSGEITAAQRLDGGLRDSLAGLARGDRLDPIEPPASLRAAILDQAHRERAGMDRGAEAIALRPRLLASRTAWATAFAAALVIAILGGLAGSRIARLAGESTTDSLVGVVAAVEQVLESPDHRVVTLRTSAGSAAGSVAWSHADFAILASSLVPPPSGEVYRCWIVRGTESDAIGEMEFAGSTAYWTGTTDAAATALLGPGSRFVVTLEAATAPSAATEPGVPLLEGDLGT